MSQAALKRSRLLTGCASAALALGLMLGPDPAAAQGIQGTGNVVFGSATINQPGPNETRIDIDTPTVVIDWTPFEDAGGNALNFLPNGSTANFLASQLPDFAVLNRILPATNGNIAVIDGAVISRVQGAAAPVSGGFVAFYSPTGILIGSTASFDVGRLMLTTLNTTDTNFDAFAQQGAFLTLTGAPGSTAQIAIAPGAQITATRENAFFAVVAADVEMRGIARINGSHAYVAGELVNLRFSNGLFDISVPVGTAAAGEVVTLDGTVGGPSSTGVAGDNHMIYAVARASADPISMLFRGNLGFDPAASAGIVNGEIILSANYDVFGRFVNGGLVSDGANAVFGGNFALSDTQADIFIDDFTSGSSLLAIGTHRVQATAINTASSVAGNLMLVGRGNAELIASNGQAFTIAGDLLVDARDYGVVSSSLQTLDAINAQGGFASVLAQANSSVTVTGNALVTADAFGGADTLNLIAGTARGGTALIGAAGGLVNINGGANLSARGFGTSLINILQGAEARGGTAHFYAGQGGVGNVGASLQVDAGAISGQGSLVNPSTASNAFGGLALMSIEPGGGTLTIGGNASLFAGARGGDSNNAFSGALADAGEARATIIDGGLIDIAGNLLLDARAEAGANRGGIGGEARGGRASAFVQNGGLIRIGNDFDADSSAVGGAGLSGGDAFGGIAGAVVNIGSITIANRAFAATVGVGGDARFGFGGNGGIGRGGNSAFQAGGTLTQGALLTIGGDATVFANGFGGIGGDTDGSAIPAGRGGDGYGGQFTVPNQADPNFNSGAFILAGGDNGLIEILGTATASARGFGGGGGSGLGAIPGGVGGNGFGGLAQAGLALLGQNGSLGGGAARFATLRVQAEGFGGNGGFSGFDFPTGPGGNGTGGNAFLTVRAGDIIADQIELSAIGNGAEGAGGGIGTGGQAGVFGSLGGTLTANGLSILAQGFGGFNGFQGAGGNALGGRAAIEGDGIAVTINGSAVVDASASGGAADNGQGGNATGGQALIATLTPNNGGIITITGHAQVLANGRGGDTALNPFAGGTGNGGLAYIDALGGGTITLGSTQVHAVGRGGDSELHEGGDGFGGTVRLNASGTGSSLTIQSNVPGAFGNTLGGIALANANGIGAITVGGDGIGGVGRGGSLDLIAGQGGQLTLPLNTSATYFARGFGGASSAQGGTGGAAFGGNLTMLVDGGGLVAGSAVLSAFAQGGNSANAAFDITGGDATGGSRTIRILNGGVLDMVGDGGGAGAQGGNGSGTGDGGNAFAGSVLFEIINSTANLSGNFILFNQSAGGTGQRGGNVSGGTITLNAVDSQINLADSPIAGAALTLSNTMQGGNGVLAGGNAQGGLVTATLSGTQVNGGRLNLAQTATGGNASDATGTGGNAIGATLATTITNSTLNLVGESVFSADARGGAGGTAGAGGSATSGAVDVDLSGSTLNLLTDALGVPGTLRVRSQADGGLGATVGNAATARASLVLAGSTVSASNLYVESRAFANTAAPGQTGGTAQSQEARLAMSGVSGITANLVEINANAASSQGGSARAGFASLQANAGATATVTAPQVNLLADATAAADDAAGIAAATQGGQTLVGANGGNLTITGNVAVNARGIGATSANLLTGATSRGGQAQLLTRLGGSVTLNGNIALDASATGADGSLVNPSSVSDAFGGSAIIVVGDGGGTLRVNGDARATANARGGRSNTTGAGSFGDAGVAIANISGAGLIDVSGRLTLDAQATGGENAGGTGGVALGGRASTTTFGGGTIRIGRLDANTLAQGGNGRTGGDAFGGIAGANAIIGEIAIAGRAFAGSEAIGGSATFGVGGNGGTGRGGSSFFQADGNLTQTARLSIAGDAVAFAQGMGGNGGAGDGVTAGGRGGDGFGGGQGNVPNQADPAFGSGAFILAGGDNGTIVIGGEAVAFGTAAGGRGGDGGPGTAGGRGGDAIGGLAQVGLALLGSPGTLGLGSAQLNRVLAQSDAFAGNGGIASLAAQNGDGGNGTGGTSALTVRAGDITATVVDITALGYGGRGGTGGNGTGGFAGVFGSLAGTLTLGQLQVISSGFGGEATGTGNGGIGRGNEAFLNFSLMDTSVTGDVLIEASGTGGVAAVGSGGNGIGGTARIGTLGTGAGNGNIAGNTRVFANGIGGVAPVGGNGTGGLAEALAANGGISRFGSLQVTASGQGAAAGQGGNGTGGTANLRASGTGSQLLVLRNTPFGVATPLNSGSILASIGLGGNTSGGNGIGGTGIGGSIAITAQNGGTLALPAQPFNDPNTIGFNRLFARGFGGGSSVEGGAGGSGTGGNATILADAGTISMGETVFSAFGQGGSSLDPNRNIAGGAAFGGSRVVRVINGGVANLHLIGGVSGGQGGNGSGTGDGGNATGGTGLVELINATLNITGDLAVVDQSTGGTGQRGGNAVGNGPNGGLRFIATDATINVTPDANGVTGLFMGGVTAGGQGVVAGGNASGPDVTLNLANTRINGGSIRIEPLAQGGAATAVGGVGGTAIAGLVNVSITGSNLALTGESLIQSDAIGGAGGATGEGGAATAGTTEVIVNGTTLAIAASGAGQPGILRVLSRATGGLGQRAGNATSGRAFLSLTGTTLTADRVSAVASAAANGGTGQTGGIATAGQAQIAIGGTGAVNTALIETIASGLTSSGGTARGGLASLELVSGNSAAVNSAQLTMEASASGANTATASNAAGRFSVNVNGGSLNLGSLGASAGGDALIGNPLASELVAVGGNINVTGSLNATTFGDVLVRSGLGAIIGSAATAGTSTAIQLEAGGAIEVRSDGGATGGLGGQSINLLAGRSILLNGNLTTRDGPITLTANRGGGQALATPGASVITMAQGARISAGTGTVTMRLIDGAGDPQRVNGAITLANVTAGRIDVRNLGTSSGSDISVLADGVLTASGTGRAIDLAAPSGEVINLAGDAGLVLTGGGHYGIFAATPTGSQIGSFANYARRYNVATASAYDALNPGGNFAAFRLAPVLTVTVNNATRIYGNANPAFTASFAGFQPGDGIANLSGTPEFSTAATLTSNVGTFAINAALGSLLSEQGYSFTFNPGLLTITPRPITVTANNLSRVYGNANPALSFTVGGEGLANGDQLVGALVTTADARTGVGLVPITQGTLAASANYVLTFVAGQLTITPRSLLVTADNLSKLIGRPDPALTFVLSGDGLVNGDQISGALAREAGEALGTYAIQQGTLSAGANYAITYVGGALTINAPPTPPELTNPTMIAAVNEVIEAGTAAAEAEAEEEERFGMDFPEQPEASLISEETLLDDPVSSGGDASLYSGSPSTPATGGGQ